MQYKTTEPVSNLGNAFFGRAQDIYHQEALGQIVDPKSKLRTYGLIKHKSGKEEYLNLIRNTKHRQKLTKFRLSNHKLMIEKGRHLNLSIEERICPICHEGIEDEIHFLVKCKQFDSLRKPIFERCTELRPQFSFYPDKEKFIYIMTTPLLLGIVSKFIHSASNDRDVYVDVSVALNGILDKVSLLM